jgi:septal ring-binding cell division protein DamX
VPDFNLKGDDSEWGSEEQSSHRRKRRWIWISISLAVILIAAVAGYVRFQHPSETGIGETSNAGDTNLQIGRDSLKVVPSAQDTFHTSVVMADSGQPSLSQSVDSTLVSVAKAETHELESTRPEVSITTARRYTLQLSAWQSEAKANEEVARLRALGIEAFISYSLPETSGKVWHRVRVGHFGTVGEAKRAAGEMVDSLVAGYTIEKDN